MKKILLTNDDGIGAEGLIRLAGTALEFGEVWVVAPKKERSAASHCITIRDTVDVHRESFPVDGVKAFSCSGFPGDCVRVASLNIMPQKPDLLLSGINYGYNTGTDLQYSATVGAAFEAVFQGFPAIALSEAAVDCHEVTDAFLREILQELIPLKPGERKIYNVNFPGCPLSECRGILRDRTVSLHSFFEDSYLSEKLPDGGVRYMVQGVRPGQAEEGSDLRALLDGYVSVGVATNIS